MTLTTDLWRGALIGAVFGGLNFWLLARIVRGMVQRGKASKWKTPTYFLIKIGLLVLIIGLILKKGYVSPLPFLAGFTVSLILGIAVMSLKSRDHSGDEAPKDAEGHTEHGT